MTPRTKLQILCDNVDKWRNRQQRYEFEPLSTQYSAFKNLSNREAEILYSHSMRQIIDATHKPTPDSTEP